MNFDLGFKKDPSREELESKTIIDLDRHVLRMRNSWSALVTVGGQHQLLQVDTFSSQIMRLLRYEDFDILLRRPSEARNMLAVKP